MMFPCIHLIVLCATQQTVLALMLQEREAQQARDKMQ